MNREPSGPTDLRCPSCLQKIAFERSGVRGWVFVGPRPPRVVSISAPEIPECRHAPLERFCLRGASDCGAPGSRVFMAQVPQHDTGDSEDDGSYRDRRLAAKMADRAHGCGTVINSTRAARPLDTRMSPAPSSHCKPRAFAPGLMPKSFNRPRGSVTIVFFVSAVWFRQSSLACPSSNDRDDETARLHHAARRRGGRMAVSQLPPKDSF